MPSTSTSAETVLVLGTLVSQAAEQPSRQKVALGRLNQLAASFRSNGRAPLMIGLFVFAFVSLDCFVGEIIVN